MSYILSEQQTLDKSLIYTFNSTFLKIKKTPCSYMKQSLDALPQNP